MRVPIFDKEKDSPMATSSNDLNVATICTLPNCYLNIQVGDVVIVGFENNTYYNAVILGHLCKQSSSTTFSDITLNKLVVNSNTTLPESTSIGRVSSSEIHCLSGVTDNLQKQINSLKEQLEIIQEFIMSN